MTSAPASFSEEANNPIDGYEALDVYQELAEELGVPIVYDRLWACAAADDIR